METTNWKNLIETFPWRFLPKNQSIVHDIVQRYLNQPTGSEVNIDNVVAPPTSHILSLLSPAHITQRDIDNNKATCCICQDDYKVDESIVQCPEWENFYQRHCIDRLLLENETCPQYYVEKSCILVAQYMLSVCK